MKRLNPRQIEAFQAVIKLGSMTRAAELLEISQPAVSRLIVDLSEAVGYQLFIRRRGGMVPTEDARRFYEQVEKLFVNMDELSRRAHAVRTLEIGSLRVAGLNPYTNGFLPPIVAEFLRRYSGIDIAIEGTSRRDQVIDFVASHRCDLGVTTLPAYAESLRVESLAQGSGLFIAAAGHPLAQKAVIQPRDLENVNFVSFPMDSPFRFQVDSIFERMGVNREMKVEASTHEAVCSLVSAGAGVSIVSPFSPYLGRNADLVFLPFKPSIPVEIGLLTDESRMSTAANIFREFVLDYFRRNSPLSGIVASNAATLEGARPGS